MDRYNDNHAVFHTTINATMDNIISIMEDTTAYPEWLYALKKVKLLETINPQEWILYFQFDVKYFVSINLFFFGDPFLIAKSTSIPDSKDHSITYTLAPAEKEYEMGAGINRIDDFYINWLFREKGDSLAIRYEVKINSEAPFFVRFLVRDYIKDTGFQTLQNLKARVNLLRYSRQKDK